MKVQIVRIGVISAMALVLMASRCTGDDETGNLETTGDIPAEESGKTANPETAAEPEPTDPLGDPFVAPSENDPAGEAEPASDNDDASMLDEPTYEPESVPEGSTDL